VRGRKKQREGGQELACRHTKERRDTKGWEYQQTKKNLRIKNTEKNAIYEVGGSFHRR